MQVAIYARVSTERQERDQTVESQIAALKAWVGEHSHTLDPAHVYVDEGYSGSRLDRPALDRLRDTAQSGEFELVAVLSPDRLARKYAYQVVLLEELRKAGCQVVFLHHPISDDPNDQLLLQIQGAIAEYERAVLGERFRRGKLQKARAGQYLGGRAPYGYRYIPKQEGSPGHLIIDEAEAEIVRMIYRWLIEEQMTIRQILKRLDEGPWSARQGKHLWSSAVIHHILSDPLYVGTAYVNRYRYVPALKPRKPKGPRSNENPCRQLRPKEEWIAIPIPAIIDEETHEKAQAQLARNAVLSFRHNVKYSYLLRCLLTCKTCGLAMSGRTEPARASHSERRYYVCRGKDPIQSAREQRCPSRPAKADELEQAVWSHVTQLLSNPQQLLAQFEHFARLTVEGDEQEQAEDRKLQARVERLEREERRLIDAYQAEVISLDELAERRHQLNERRRGLAEQQGQRARLREQAAHAQEVLGSLTSFCERIRSRLAEATLAEKQSILQLLIERIIVGEDTLEIRHVIPLHSAPPGAPSPGPPIVRLRSGGVEHAALVVHPPQGPTDEAHQPAGPVAGHPPQRLDRQPGPPGPGKQPLPGPLALFPLDHHRRVDQPSHVVHQRQDHPLGSTPEPRPEPIGPDLPGGRHPVQLPLHRRLGLLTCPLQPAMHRRGPQLAPRGLDWRGLERSPEQPALLASQQRAGELGRAPQGASPVLPEVDAVAVDLPGIPATPYPQC